MPCSLLSGPGGRLALSRPLFITLTNDTMACHPLLLYHTWVPQRETFFTIKLDCSCWKMSGHTVHLFLFGKLLTEKERNSKQLYGATLVICILNGLKCFMLDFSFKDWPQKVEREDTHLPWHCFHCSVLPKNLVVCSADDPVNCSVTNQIKSETLRTFRKPAVSVKHAWNLVYTCGTR